jgi:hypothetical protein
MTPVRRAKWIAAQLAMMAKPLTRVCAYCGAGVGAPCITKLGQPIYKLDGLHAARLNPAKPKYTRFRA